MSDDGIKQKVMPQPLRQARPLNFDLKTYHISSDLSETERVSLESQIFDRMQRLEKLVHGCCFTEAGARVPPQDAIQALQNRSAELEASSELKQDLNQLLIAALVKSRSFLEPLAGQDAPKEVDTFLWSFRRLSTAAPEEPVENWGPPIETSPGKILLIPVLNLLDKSELEQATTKQKIVDPVPSGGGVDGRINAPGEFDVINLHTHGLNVSPCNPSDNVFRKIYPYQLKFYVYHIPDDHPAGTFFYHPHNHGSVATQVAGGMAGPLIVRDTTKGLDKLGVDSQWHNDETTLMFQQLSLFQADGRAASTSPLFGRPDYFAMKDIGPWTGDSGNEEWVRRCSGPREELANLATLILRYDPSFQFFKKHDVQTWVSGQLQPELFAENKVGDPARVLHLRPGQTRRLRLIHAGVEANINFAVRSKTKVPSAPSELPMQVVAFDGIPLRTPFFISGADRSQDLLLAPANRADVLLYVPAEAEGETYEFYSKEGDVLLASFTVGANEGNPVAAPGWVEISKAQQIFENELGALKVTAVTDPNTEAFNLEFADAQVDKDGFFKPGVFTIDNKTFPGDQKRFRVGETRQLAFAVTNGNGGHPLHIHVNPFLIPADSNRSSLGLPVCEYWSDTALIQPNQAINSQMTFHRWSGRMVSHCHILDHEDAGMMNMIEIRPPHGRFPMAPLPGVFDIRRLTKETFDSLIYVPADEQAPLQAGIPANVADTVTVVFFLPSVQGDACPHCAASVSAVARLRDALPKNVKVRIIAISGSGRDKSPSYQSLGLDPQQDVLCLDQSLKVFEHYGMIDGTPVRTPKGLTYPSSFNTPGDQQTIKVESDVMHGLLIASPSGFIRSARRDFLAFDDAEQIVAEVQLAASEVHPLSSGVELSANPAAKTWYELDDKRQQQRRKAFDESATTNEP